MNQVKKINVMIAYFVIFCLSSKILVNGQGITASGDPYFCAPIGVCPGSGGIDPRIVTPDQNNPTTPPPGTIVCPAGRAPCYAQGPMSNCGVRPATITNTADGFAQTGAYPWQVFLTNNGGPTGFAGSGVLLSPYHVLTAAHKVLAYQGNPSTLQAVVGVNNPATMNNPVAPRSPVAAIMIPGAPIAFSNATLKNDIAVLRLSTPITLVNNPLVNTLCLPTTSQAIGSYIGQRCTVSGWGQIDPSNTAVPTQMKQVNVPIVNYSTCVAGFTGRVDVATYLDQNGQICAGGEARKDACFQDGGAPLQCGQGTAASRFTLTGLVIWGKSCGTQGVYGVYTNVYYYRDWIISQITQAIP